MGGKIPSTRKRVQPGRAGLSRHGENPALAYWLENMVITEDGYYRPRYGTKHIKTMAAGEINHISKPGGYNHELILIGESGKLYNLDIETGTATLLGTGWPTGPMASIIGLFTSGVGARWMACKAQIGGTSGPVFHFDGTTLTEIATTYPDDGNYIGTYLQSAMRVKSGVGDNTAVQWSKNADCATWDALYASKPVCGIGTVDAVVGMGQESILFGPRGLVRVSGIPPRNLSFAPIEELEIATPMNHIAKCRDRIFFCAAGPRVYQFVSPGKAVPIEQPIFRDLMLAQGTVNLRAWYDAITDEYVLWDRTQFLGYRYSLRENRWAGITTFGAGSSNMLGQVVIDQGASSVDQATQPWAKAFYAVSNLIVQTDPSAYTDATSSSTTAAYTCKVEAQIERPDPSYRYQLLSLGINAAGTWTPYVKYRSSPDGSFTTITGSAITGPGRWELPLSSVEWTEVVVGASASSASTLRFHSFEPEWQVSGRP